MSNYYEGSRVVDPSVGYLHEINPLIKQLIQFKDLYIGGGGDRAAGGGGGVGGG